MTENYLDHSYFIKLQELIDSIPPGPERLRYQGILDRFVVKLEELPERAANAMAGVTNMEELRAIFCRELEHVVSELPERMK